MNCSANTKTHLHLCHFHTSSLPWKPFVYSSPSLLGFPSTKKISLFGESTVISLTFAQHIPISAAATAPHSNDTNDNFMEDGGILDGNTAKGSGTTARGRRLLKVREEKRKREYDRLHKYPAWAKVLENACQNDEELRAILGDSIGNPELMRKKESRKVVANLPENRESALLSRNLVGNSPQSRRKRAPNSQSSTGAMALRFDTDEGRFDFERLPLCSMTLDRPRWCSDRPRVVRRWRLKKGFDRRVEIFANLKRVLLLLSKSALESATPEFAHNIVNLYRGELANSLMEHNPLYDADKGFKVMPSSFHDISDVEFQDNWGRVWVDLGTSDFFAIDILLNCLTVLSSDSDWFSTGQQVIVVRLSGVNVSLAHLAYETSLKEPEMEVAVLVFTDDGGDSQGNGGDDLVEVGST
ncbi:structural maintenance of chromosomes-like protein, putative [Actinidia rufa]|uniref:Structural maintenance of chromosomes-like protein, putative n=1 Tax=Actinidia rufa TaxID=165716 RepID=A0A7J0E5E0_9ERIC|nr:structural maintenance of chromosomes-like protein, putative [Actinidia rufa]